MCDVLHDKPNVVNLVRTTTSSPRCSVAVAENREMLALTNRRKNVFRTTHPCIAPPDFHSAVRYAAKKLDMCIFLK